MFINDTRVIHWQHIAGRSFSFLELTNNSLDPAAQFRFRDNGAMFNLKKQGCLFPSLRGDSGYFLFLYAASSSEIDNLACHRDYAISQTCWGGLSTLYNIHTCAVPKTNEQLANNEGIDPYIALTNCNNTKDKHFNFGKFLRPNIRYYCSNTQDRSLL